MACGSDRGFRDGRGLLCDVGQNRGGGKNSVAKSSAAQLGVIFKDAFRVRKSIFKERKLTMQQVDKPRRAPRILAALFSAVLAAGALVSAVPALAA